MGNTYYMNEDFRILILKRHFPPVKNNQNIIYWPTRQALPGTLIITLNIPKFGVEAIFVFKENLPILT